MLFTACSPKGVYLFTSFHEPATEGLRFLYSKDAYSWHDLDTTFLKPLIDGKVMRDPSIARGADGTFHLVWTSAWKGNKGFGHASSKDLIHWSEQEHIEVMKSEPATVNVWAPELFYDQAKHEYIIIWASTIPFRFPKGLEEEDNNHRMYVTTTRDFKNFSDTKLFYDPGFSAIDAVIVQRSKNDFVLVVKDNTRPNRNLKAAFGKEAAGPYSAASAAFSPNFTEGPAVAKAGRDWLIYFDQYREKIFGVMKTRDFQHFTDITNTVKVPEGHKHGTIIKVSPAIIEKLLKYSGKKNGQE